METEKFIEIYKKVNEEIKNNKNKDNSVPEATWAKVNEIYKELIKEIDSKEYFILTFYKQDESQLSLRIPVVLSYKAYMVVDNFCKAYSPKQYQEHSLDLLENALLQDVIISSRGSKIDDNYLTELVNEITPDFIASGLAAYLLYFVVNKNIKLLKKKKFLTNL